MSKQCEEFILSFYVTDFFNFSDEREIPGVKSVAASDSRRCTKRKPRQSVIDKTNQSCYQSNINNTIQHKNVGSRWQLTKETYTTTTRGHGLAHRQTEIADRTEQQRQAIAVAAVATRGHRCWCK
ncbi:hypothetical protein J6590_050621 [Homalodisca vitripennis]|nr:hypothetical protein J6590_050621 [Homalodisca vitripennis]